MQTVTRTVRARERAEQPSLPESDENRRAIVARVVAAMSRLDWRRAKPLGTSTESRRTQRLERRADRLLADAP
jgi:hypothetical protein